MEPSLLTIGPDPALRSDAAPLSIAYYSPGWPPNAFPNGIVSSVAAIAEGMRHLGHRTHILTGHCVESSVPTENVLALPLDGRSNRRPVRWLHALASRLTPEAARDARMEHALRLAVDDLLHRSGLQLLEMEESFGWASAVTRRIPVVVRLHGPWFLNGEAVGAPRDEIFARRVRREGRAIADAQAISAPSRDVLERTRAHYRLALENAEIIPYPTPPIPSNQRWRPEQSEPDLVLFIGRFDRHKGGDTVIDAFARLLRDRPGIRMAFVGPDRGLERDGRSWSLLEYIEHRLPGALGRGHVRWLGQRPHGELNALRRQAAITVMASRYENFPMALLEALAMGCPVVATRAGGAAEAFEDGVHGLQCAPDDPDDMASKLNVLLAHPARAAEMGRLAGEHCRRHYHPETVAARTVDFYRRVLARAGRPVLPRSQP